MHRSTSLVRSLAATACLVTSANAHAAEAVRYIITKLQVPGQYITQITGMPNSLNDRDEVVGSTISQSRIFQGFFWKSGAFTLFPACTGLAVINDRERAIGYPANGGGYSVVAVKSGGIRVNPIHGPDNGLRLEAVNSSGDVVAQASTRRPVAVGLLLSGRHTQVLQVPGSNNRYGGTSPTGIDTAGIVVGSWSDSAGVTHGFTYGDAAYTSFDMPAAAGTYPYFINDNGDVGGGYTVSGSGGVTTGFVRQNGGFTSISPPGATGSYVQGIGPGGEIVGSFFDAGHNRHGFVLRGSTYSQFDVPGAAGTAVAGVNRIGSLVGTYYDNQQLPHAFLAQCPGKICK